MQHPRRPKSRNQIGRFDREYVQKLRAIGLRQAKIDLQPRWYIGGYILILDHLVNAVTAAI